MKYNIYLVYFFTFVKNMFMFVKIKIKNGNIKRKIQFHRY